MKITRRQRGFYLAATQTIKEIGNDIYQIRDYTVNGRCNCPDHIYRKKHCKHMQAVEFLREYGRPSLMLAMLMAAGGGEIVTARRGGIGRYERLEGNSLLIRPIALAEGDDGRLYPAAIVCDLWGDYLQALTDTKLTKRLAPDLHELVKSEQLAGLFGALQSLQRKKRKKGKA
jgi:hypothetical protein